MVLKLKQKLLDDKGLFKLLDKMAAEIVKEGLDFKNCIFIGILKNGAPFAEYLSKKVGELTSSQLPVAYVDITLYRDDLIDSQFDPYLRKTEVPFAITNKEVILVDDVLFTGRTVRAALASILVLGRPRLIRLAVAVDRGHKELPIHSDFTGMTCKTTLNQGIRVRVNNPEQEDGVYLYEDDATTSK